MNMSFALLSGDAVASAETAGGMGSSYIISIIVLVFVFYHLLCVPEKKKREKREKREKRQEMLKTMKIGDVVLTTGDFYGVVVDITGEDVIVRFGGEDKGCCILMKKSAIAEVITAEK